MAPAGPSRSVIGSGRHTKGRGVQPKPCCQPTVLKRILLVLQRFCLAAVVFVVFAATLFAEKREVTIPADDGFLLKGTLYSAGKSGPGLLLLHQCNADRRIYDNLGAMLSTAGYKSHQLIRSK
jgi:hypothetical protein